MTAVPVATKPVGVGWDPRRYFGGFWRHPFARAVLKAVLTVWVTTTLTFFLIRLMPGNPVELKIDELIQTAHLALLIILFAGVQWHLINFTSMRGAYTSGLEPGFTPAFIADIFYHAALPITIYFLTPLGHWILSMRSATLSALEEDYVTAARARGLSDGRIRTAYVGRNAVLPLVTQLAISVGFIVGGAAVIEQLFAYQGVGKRLLDSVTQRDYPVIQGVVLLTTISVVVANLAADLLYSKLDPRIGRAGGAAG